mgnify:CR=1 FL=1
MPEGDCGAWGVDGAGMDPNGMPSNEDNTLVDHGYNAPGCVRPAKPDPRRLLDWLRWASSAASRVQL